MMDIFFSSHFFHVSISMPAHETSWKIWGERKRKNEKGKNCCASCAEWLGKLKLLSYSICPSLFANTISSSQNFLSAECTASINGGGNFIAFGKHSHEEITSSIGSATQLSVSTKWKWLLVLHPLRVLVLLSLVIQRSIMNGKRWRTRVPCSMFQHSGSIRLNLIKYCSPKS